MSPQSGSTRHQQAVESHSGSRRKDAASIRADFERCRQPGGQVIGVHIPCCCRAVSARRGQTAPLLDEVPWQELTQARPLGGLAHGGLSSSSHRTE